MHRDRARRLDGRTAMWGPGRPAVSAVAAAVAARAENLVKRYGRVAGILPGGVEVVTAASAAAAQAQQLNRAPIEVTALRKRFGSAVALDGVPSTVLPAQVTDFVGLLVRPRSQCHRVHRRAAGTPARGPRAWVRPTDSPPSRPLQPGAGRRVAGGRHPRSLDVPLGVRAMSPLASRPKGNETASTT